MALSRRGFIASSAAFAAMTGFDKPALAAGEGDFIWAYMPQFGMDMWGDILNPRPARDGIMLKFLTDAEYEAYCKPENRTRDAIRFDEGIWRELSAKLKTNGCNLVLIDVGEFLAYPSHPELAVEGSWSADRLTAEVRRLKAMGFQIVPKVNFSCCHDAWLRKYQRMVSTAKYYQVTADIIRDVAEVFEHPAYIHLGMDEEDILEYQSRNSSLVRMRQGDLWWHDLLFFVKEVEKRGARAWIWSDYLRRHTVEDFVKHMPKTVVQSPWTYRTEAPSFDDPLIKLYKTLTDNGYDTIPCASNCYGLKRNFPETAAFCRKNLDPKHYKGMLFAPWMATIGAWRRLLLEGADIFGSAVRG